MRIYKKIAALALSGVMTLGLMAGCSTTETETTPTTAPTVNQATSPTESEGASEANGLNAPITVISRDLKEEELAEGLTPVKIAMDGIAVIVNEANPVTGLTTEQIRNIFLGNTTNWSELG